MAARRFQNPSPERVGDWWYIRLRQDVSEDGILTRKLKRIKIAPAETPFRQVQRMVAEKLRPMNQGLMTAGSATRLTEFVNNIYIPNKLSLLRKPTRDRYLPIIDNVLLPQFGSKMLSELNYVTLQTFCASLDVNLSYESRDKIRDVLASIVQHAIKSKYLTENPMVGIELVHDKTTREKPTITPEEFGRLVDATPEPYATMLYVAGWTGLRVSELLALKWRSVHSDSITIKERFCRGDWDVPKTKASAATIGVIPEVIDRLHRLKTLTVTGRHGGQGAVREYKVVKSSAEDDLVFQGLRSGGAMSDKNVLSRFIRPVAKRLGITVNWQILRRSHATWFVQAGADPKSVQRQMRHTRISTTMDIYAQAVPQQQRIALGKLKGFVTEAGLSPLSHLSQKSEQNAAEELEQPETIQ